jgi:hypothetical protein
MLQQKRRKIVKLKKKLEQRILELEQKTDLNDNEQHELNKIKTELIGLREKRMEGVLLRSRARWIADGEKVTKYFCALEKRNYVNKHMFKLKRQDDSVLIDSKEIVTEVNCFYEHLYTERKVNSNSNSNSKTLLSN